jgi:hypothetical protein
MRRHWAVDRLGKRVLSHKDHYGFLQIIRRRSQAPLFQLRGRQFDMEQNPAVVWSPAGKQA